MGDSGTARPVTAVGPLKSRPRRSAGWASGTDGGADSAGLAPSTIHVRDSKDAADPRLDLAPDAWASFVTYASER
ncbi:DUF397 domain-containing protein [Streptomyces sp. NPDC127020]|uniref:DUF397 domain-containing protein n=1 Tax=Streptomyces sp. NPDC127020 TaxID=3347109 RepID=UPI00365420DB